MANTVRARTIMLDGDFSPDTSCQGVNHSQQIVRHFSAAISFVRPTDRRGQARPRPEQDRSCGSEELPGNRVYPHAQLVVGLELVAMAGSADALKTFAAVWTACS